MSTNGAAQPEPGRLLRLVQLSDSALPIGGYSQSWGLEAAIERGQVKGPAEVEAWARSWLTSSVAPADGMLAAHAARAAAARAWDQLAALNDLAMANKVSKALREASLKQGSALLQLASAWPWSGETAAFLRAASAGRWHHALVFGALAQAAGAVPRETLALYLQNALAGLLAAAVRAVPIGHTHGQQVLARLQGLLLALADQWAEAPLESFGALCPAYEVLIYAQSQLYTRIFQS